MGRLLVSGRILRGLVDLHQGEAARVVFLLQDIETQHPGLTDAALCILYGGILEGLYRIRLDVDKHMDNVHKSPRREMCSYPIHIVGRYGKGKGRSEDGRF